MDTLLHLTDIAQQLDARIAKAKEKDPALWPGIQRNIARLEAASMLIADVLDGGGDPQTNGTVPVGGGD